MITLFTILGFSATFLLGAYFIFGAIISTYVTYAFSGRMTYGGIIPLIIGCAIVYAVILNIPFDFVIAMK